MGSNQIRGDIPEWIGDLENLGMSVFIVINFFTLL